MGDYVNIIKATASASLWSLWMCEETIPGSGTFVLSDSSGNSRNTNAIAIANFSNVTTLLTGRSQAISRAAGAGVGVFGGLPVTGNNPWTIEVWFRTTSIQAGEKMLAGFGTNANHQTAIAAVFGGFPFLDTNGPNITTAAALNANQTYYLVYRWNGGPCDIYQDVVQVASGTLAAMTTPSGTSEIWNAPAGVGGTDAVCTLQGMAFYSGVLSTADMTTHHNAGLGIFPSSRKVYAVGSLPLVGASIGKAGQVG